MSKISSTLTVTTLPKNFFSAFKKDAQVTATKLTEEAAKQAATDAKQIILKQQYTWAPLSPKYLDYKIKHGLDRRILVATKDYVKNGIGWWKEKGYVFVGPLPGIHKPSRLTYYQISRIFEFGTWTMPARPLWRTLLSITLQRNRIMQQKYYKAMREALINKSRLTIKTVKA